MLRLDCDCCIPATLSGLSASASGYGIQGRSLLPRLAELPEFGGEVGSKVGRENIANFAWYGLQGGLHEVDGFRIYPAFDDPYGNDVLGAHTQHFNANLVISLIDVWVLREPARQVAPALFCPWLPIDHDPVPPMFLQALQGAHLPLTYAKWGHEMLTKAGVENVYIPHGIEPSVYHVMPDREEVRKFKRWLTGNEECFLCVMVAANKGFPDRKWFQGQLEAFRDFAEPLWKDGKDVKLYLHTLPTPVHGGVDFNALTQMLGLQGKLIFPHPYLLRNGYPPQHLALVYNAADVLLGASMSEGFGIPLIEAQGCGCPVVTTNFSAMPELVRWGYAVEVADKVMTAMHAYHAWPSKRDMTDKLTRLYEAWTICGGDWPISQRLRTSQAIHEEYSWDVIVRDQWGPLMTRLADEAPSLDKLFTVPQMPDDVDGFVNAVNEGLAKETLKRRVAPFKPVTPKEAGRILDEVAIDNITGEHRTLDELRAATNVPPSEMVVSNEEWNGLPRESAL